MLRQLERISIPGVFDGFRWDSSVSNFKRVNVLFGPNGSGKSTLCRFLAALNPTDGNSAAGFVVGVEDASGSRNCSTIGDAVLNRLYVFNDEYVARAHRLTDDSPEMPMVLTLGERDAKAEDRLNELDKLIVDRKATLTEQRIAQQDADKLLEKLYKQVSGAIVSDAASAGGRYASRGKYSAGTVKSAFTGSHDEWALLSDTDLQTQKKVVASSKPEPLSEGTFSVKLEKDIDQRCASALGATPVSITLDTLAIHPRATNWVDDGRELHAKSQDCIFCGQALAAERKEAIEAHFSDAVEKLKADIAGLVTELRGKVERVEELEKQMPRKAQFREDHRDGFEVARAAWEIQAKSFKDWCNATVVRLEEKGKNVLGTVDAEVVDVPELDGETIGDLRDKHNQEVEAHGDSVELAALQIERHHLKSHESEVSSVAKDLKDAQDTVANLVAELRLYEDEAAALRQVDGDPKPSAEVLTKQVAQLLGRNELQFRVTANGRYTVTRRGDPATGLSTGERTAISLVHFLETIARADTSAGKPIVVIDDPVSSLDSNVFMGISTLIWSEMITKDRADQLFLLTHSFELFRQWDIQLEGLHKNDKLKQQFSAQLYELRPRHLKVGLDVERRVQLKTWPESPNARRKVRSSYHHGFIALADAYESLLADDSLEHRLDAQLLFPNVMRRLLETFLAFKRPEWAADFTGAMRNSAKLLADSGYTGDADALRTRLTRYAHAYSHDESPETDKPVEPDEVRTAIESTFEFMNAIDPDHFAGLCKVTEKVEVLRLAGPSPRAGVA